MNLQRMALKLDGQPISVGEVLAGSLLGGWLKPLKQRVSEQLACTALAGARNMEVPAERVQKALDEWRIERDLIAADEMDAWLASTGLDLEALAGHLERRILREQLEQDLAEAMRRFAPEPDDVLALAAGEAVLGGEIPELARDFGIRAVVPEPEDLGDREAGARRQLLEPLGAEDLEALRGQMDLFGVSMERAEWLLRIEAMFLLYREDYVTKTMPPRALKQMFSELTKYEVKIASYPAQDIAREALCCIQVDGEPFERVANMAEADCRTEAVFGSELKNLPFGERFFAARPGDLFGPEEETGRYLLGQLVSRVEPDLSQPDVVVRLTVRIIERSLRRVMSERVFLPPATFGAA